MDQNTEHPYGLLPTRRHGAILALFLALLSAALIPFSALVRVSGGANTPFLVALLVPWLLGTLIVMFDRPGPVRNWAGPLLISLFYPTLALSYDWAIVAQWVRSGSPPDLRVALVGNVALLGGFSLYAASMLPRRCPACGQRGLIPLLRLWRQERRTSKTRWCASCKGMYWRDRGGVWREERRKTWLDTARERPGVEGTTSGAVLPPT
jgi:hypothetical protein